MKKNKMRVVCILTALIIMITNFNVVLAKESDFKDVVNYYPYNSWAVQIGEKYNLIFLEDNTRECKRYEIASLFYHVLNLKPVEDRNVFNDLIELDKNIKNVINSAAKSGIISGYNDGSFKPNNNVTRAEFVTMLDRTGILNNKKAVNNITFLDTDKHWAKKSIEKVSSLGIVAGKGDNMFCPDVGITPQEILIIMDRLVNIGCITDADLLTSMLNTFKCKQYSDKEKYIVEVMYSQFDKVQSFMTYSFPYKRYYEYNNWNELASYEDIQFITYFMMSYNSNLLDTGEKRDLFNNIGKTILSKKISNSEYWTIRDFLYAVSEIEVVANVNMYGYGSNRNTQMPTINYTNKEDFIEADNEMFRRILGNQNNTLLTNEQIYFPFDAPLTKYMLNYFAMMLEETYNSYNKSLSYGIAQYNGYSIEFESDTLKIPSNYYQYPYIIKGIPKEVYEKPYSYSDKFKMNTPIECYEQYAEVMKNIGDYARIYYDAILNVDYRNLDEAKFTNDISRVFYYVSKEDINKYIQYVKDNEIIIKGKGAAVPGTLFLVDGTLFMKSIAEFEIISAKEKKNVLFGDLWQGLGYDIQYTENNYLLYPDIEVYTGPYIYNGEVTNIRKLAYRSLHLGIYPYGESHKLP